MGEVARRHHTVPQFYLKGFARGDQIATVGLPGDRRFVQSVRRAASENDFYTLPGHTDGSDAFEKLLSEIEGRAKGVFDKINHGTWPLQAEDRDALAFFIVLQALRGPDQRRNIELVSARITRLEVGYGGRANVHRWASKRLGFTITEEEAGRIWQEATQPGGPPIRVAPSVHIKQILDMADRMFPYVAGRPMVLVVFRRRSLITSDSPVGLVRNAFDDDDPFEGVGFGTAAWITYPMTRKIGLMLRDPFAVAQSPKYETVASGRFDIDQEGTTVHEKFLNQHAVANASQWLYHHPDDERFVPERLPDPSPTSFEVFGDPEEFSGEAIFASEHRMTPPVET